MKIRIINRSKHSLPIYSTVSAAGIMDIRASLSEEIILKPLERRLITAGLYLEIPEGDEAKIRPSSGLAINKGITVLHSPGTIDADYRGEVCIILLNLSNENFVKKDGERICQMVIANHEKAEWIRVEALVDTDRGSGEFGHTGIK